jgi:DNA-binding winged helix-turn-helix (wHTH) protein
MIGHQVLNKAKDTTSIIKPIIKKNDQYIIQFESEFEFIPEDLVGIVNQVMRENDIVNKYVVEVVSCDLNEIVYSFEINDLQQSNIVPCKSRIQPKSCYNLVFSLYNADPAESSQASEKSFSQVLKKNYLYFILSLTIIGLIIFLLWRRAKNNTIDPNLISLGECYFDQLNSELIIEQKRIELTGKESDLLLLLYNAANATLEREKILEKVWGDEGDYVGRTLDVTISKLRKKLEFNKSVKIVNVRGIGYKLVLNKN